MFRKCTTLTTVRINMEVDADTLTYFRLKSGGLEFIARNKKPRVGAGDSIAGAKGRIAPAQLMTSS